MEQTKTSDGRVSRNGCRLGAVALSLGVLLFVACQESFDQRLQREAKEYTERHCPMEPEPGTRLDSTTYSPQKQTYTLWFTLSNSNEQVLFGREDMLRRQLIEQLRSDVDYKALKDKGINFNYVYRSAASGRTLYETTLTVKDYR